MEPCYSGGQSTGNNSLVAVGIALEESGVGEDELMDFPQHIRDQPRHIGRTEQELPFRPITGFMHKKALSWAYLRGKKCRESAYMFQLLRQLYPEEELLTTIIVKQRNCRNLMDLFTSNVMAVHYVSFLCSLSPTSRSSAVRN